MENLMTNFEKGDVLFYKKSRQELKEKLESKLKDKQLTDEEVKEDIRETLELSPFFNKELTEKEQAELVDEVFERYYSDLGRKEERKAA